MIQAHELRIGNWVLENTYNYNFNVRPSTQTLTKQTPIKVEDVNTYDVEGVNLRLYYEGEKEYVSFGSIDPIPLTPEILEACGFAKYVRTNTDECSDNFSDWDAVLQYKDGKVQGYEVWIGKAIDLGLKDGKHYLIHTGASYDEQTVIYNKYKMNIAYLHQLQNLCFALTGQELEVNLPANQTT